MFIPLFSTLQDIVTSTEIYIEVTLKPLDASDNQTGVNNIIIVLVPRSQIDNHRAEHQVREALIDELIAQALAEGRVPDIGTRVGSTHLIERSKFLPERPKIVEGRSPDYDREGFRGWFFNGSIVS